MNIFKNFGRVAAIGAAGFICTAVGNMLSNWADDKKEEQKIEEIVTKKVAEALSKAKQE